ncbi:MAB_1171c family putative transporter [Saccharopolyspora sp. NPDC002686]|uniref:MAB_1171c family putative transporter n=1 Tax=Saccharopolyspora sp. NPDC002686 TaxID=3154541 RepID=UPI003332193C
MTSIVLQTAGLIAVLAAVAKLVQSRHSPTPSVLYLCGAIGSVGLSAALVATSSLTWVATWEPVPNSGRLAANMLAVVAAVCVHGLLANLVHEKAAARRAMRLQVLVAAVAAVCMVALMLAAGIPFHPEFLAAFADRPAVAAYLTVFSLYIGWATLAFGWFLRRYISQTDRRWLRAGLRTIQAGCVASGIWAASKIAAAFRALAGHQPGILDPIGGACAATCVALVAIGATMPVWGPRVALPFAWLRAKRQAQQLRPLWNQLSAELPQIALPAGMIAPNAQFALYRRVVEIRDAQLLLRPYVHPSASGWARRAAEEAGLDERAAHQTAEAARLVTALDAHAAGHRHQPEPDETSAPYRGVTSDTATEARWLIEVGRAAERSAIVKTIRDQARADLPTSPA